MLELNLNEILVEPVVAADTTIAVESPLYNIESTNTLEARIQSVSTDNGNEHTVQKFSNESLIATKIPEGKVALVGAIPAEQQHLAALAIIFLK